MNHNPRNGPGDAAVRDGMNVAYGIGVAAANVALPFLRRGFGEDVPGFYGVAAFFVLLICSVGDPAVAIYLAFWVAALIGQRAERHRRAKLGIVEHSRYWGDSICGRIPFVRSEYQARSWEWLLCFALAFLSSQFSERLALLLSGASLGLALVNGTDYGIARRRLKELRNGRIQMEADAALYRNGGDLL